MGKKDKKNKQFYDEELPLYEKSLLLLVIVTGVGLFVALLALIHVLILLMRI